MSNEKEQKPTVLEANMAFDASPALFESIMNEGPIQYGPEDSGIDMITTPEGDEVVDPRSIMDVNVDSPVQSGAVFNSDIDPISDEEGDQYMDQFREYIENVHKQSVDDEDIEVGSTLIQMLNDSRQDIGGYISEQIKEAAARLSQQNTNPAQPNGVAADMTGDDRIPPSDGGLDSGLEPDLGGTPDLGDDGLKEIDSTTHLTPEEDAGLGGDLGGLPSDTDLGLGGLDAGSEAPAELGLDTPAEPSLGEETPAEPEAGSEPSGEDNYDPFSDLDLGDGEGDGASEEPAPASEEPASGDEPASDEEPATDEEPAPIGDEPSASEDEPAPVDEAPASDDEEKKDKPLTESIYSKEFLARLESVDRAYDRIVKHREAQAKCEAIVKAANTKMLAEAANQKKLKAQCEAIVGAYRAATNQNTLKAKLESIVGKYTNQKMVAESVTASQNKAVLESENRLQKMKAQCESIVNNFRKAEYTANAARAIIDNYKQQLV